MSNLRLVDKDSSNSAEQEKKGKIQIINSIIKDFGGLSVFDKFLSRMLMRIIPVIKYFDKKKKISKYITICAKFIPDVLIAYQFYDSISQYVKNKKTTVCDVDKKMKEDILKVPYDDIHEYEFNVGKEVLLWLGNKPSNIESFKIISFYDVNYDKINNIDFSKEGINFILLEDKESTKFLIKISSTNLTNSVYIRYTSVFIDYKNNNKIELLRENILKQFISKFAIDDNIIYYSSIGLSCKKKEKVYCKINQINIDSIVSEINNSIKLKKKRGLVFCGPAGTGKTSIIHEIGNRIKEIPFIYISPNTLEYIDEIKTFFNFIRSIKPCIVVFEDMDANENMEEKNNRVLGSFLEGIDSVKGENENLIFIATINDTSLVHKTLIGRRGRFDKVFYVDAPKTKKEIYEVMCAKFESENSTPFPIEIKKMNNKFFKLILKNKLTHSDICEIIENLIIMDKSISKDSLMDSLNDLLNSKNAIEKSFNYCK